MPLDVACNGKRQIRIGRCSIGSRNELLDDRATMQESTIREALSIYPYSDRSLSKAKSLMFVMMSQDYLAHMIVTFW